MANSSLNRDYEITWPLLETILREAAIMKRSFVHVWNIYRTTALDLNFKKLSRSEISERYDHVHEAAKEMNPIDAFAMSFFDEYPISVGTVEDIAKKLGAEGDLLNLVWWIEAWRRCRTKRDLGHQAVITILLLRDDKECAARLSGFLSERGRIAEDANDFLLAYRCYFGTLLCNKNPQKEDVEKLKKEIGERHQSDPEVRIVLEKQQPLINACNRSMPKTYTHEVHINRLREAMNNAQMDPYKSERFSSREDLETYIDNSVCFSLKGEAEPSGQRIKCCIGLDLVGAISKDTTKMVYSYAKSNPRKIARNIGKKNAQEWDADLEAFLKRDIDRNPVTLKDLIGYHEPDEDPEQWLFPPKSGSGNPNLLAKETRERLKSSEVITVETLITILSQQLAKAKSMRRQPNNANWKTIDGWCRSVSRYVLDKTKVADGYWIAKCPPKKGAKPDSPLTFNKERNYGLIRYVSSTS